MTTNTLTQSKDPQLAFLEARIAEEFQKHLGRPASADSATETPLRPSSVVFVPADGGNMASDVVARPDVEQA